MLIAVGVLVVADAVRAGQQLVALLRRQQRHELRVGGVRHHVVDRTHDEVWVERLLDLRELPDALRAGFRDLSAGRIAAPGRNQLAMPGEAFLLAMPGHRHGAHMMVNVVTVFEQNLQCGLPSHLATIGLYDAETGACRCLMDGTAITALRTSAAAVLSADLLARPDARVAAPSRPSWASCSRTPRAGVAKTPRSPSTRPWGT